jgi:pimeloyl-ACP methyl ester carboxylesterase
VKLFYRESGKGETLIILHGLYGSSDNWVSISKELEPFFRVINVDQRNHGQSPHSSEHSYSVLANDLLELFNDLNLEKAILLGHSMGGKTAMQFTFDHPERVSSLIVVDISPWSHIGKNEYSTRIVEDHRNIIDGLLSIPIDKITSRNQANAILSEWVKAEYIRQFLLKNLKREHDGSFTWKLNLPIISSNIVNLMSGIEIKSHDFICKTKTLFIRGELSNYIPTAREEDIKKIFVNSKIVTIEKSGHWVHAEKPKEFLAAVITFLKH